VHHEEDPSEAGRVSIQIEIVGRRSECRSTGDLEVAEMVLSSGVGAAGTFFAVG
jgi:hypothetical protein